MISVTSASIKNALTQSNDEDSDGFTSNAVRDYIISCQASFISNFFKAIVAVGGSQEVVYARPGNYHIVLKDRKGFIKIALQTGASLVPVFSFGENDIYNQPSTEPGTVVRKLQDLIKNLIGITPPVVNGRGFFQYSYGLIPRRLPITTVVGTPIDVIKNQSPTDKEIEELHKKFVESLTKLFDDHKSDFTADDDIQLILK